MLERFTWKARYLVNADDANNNNKIGNSNNNNDNNKIPIFVRA